MSCSNVVRRAAGLFGIFIAAQSLGATPDQVVCRDQPRPGPAPPKTGAVSSDTETGGELCATAR